MSIDVSERYVNKELMNLAVFWWFSKTIPMKSDQSPEPKISKILRLNQKMFSVVLIVCENGCGISFIRIKLMEDFYFLILKMVTIEFGKIRK